VRNLEKEIKFPQTEVEHREIPLSVVNAQTGIQALDQAIQQLYTHGYMHNHLRMYTAAVVTNIGKAHWFLPSKWMYYHLLDGDFASNACSWQWVAGANSSKKYFANQENINRFSGSTQSETFLDTSYEELEILNPPHALLLTQTLNLQTPLPTIDELQINVQIPTFVYNYYNLDPLWHIDEIGNRILLIDPAFFSAYPVSQKCIEFIIDLSKNIPNIQLYVGSFESLQSHYNLTSIYFKEHPLNTGYVGIEEPRDWISEDVSGYFPSFFSYWKKVEKQLKISNQRNEILLLRLSQLPPLQSAVSF
jgi:deoxyribodipyrimidine photo-lyase